MAQGLWEYRIASVSSLSHDELFIHILVKQFCKNEKLSWPNLQHMPGIVIWAPDKTSVRESGDEAKCKHVCSFKKLDLVEHANMPRTSLASIWAWKIVTDCLGNLSTSAKLPTKAITINFVICIGLD